MAFCYDLESGSESDSVDDTSSPTLSENSLKRKASTDLKAKFLELRQKRLAICEKSTARRVAALQKTALQNVEASLGLDFVNKAGASQTIKDAAETQKRSDNSSLSKRLTDQFEEIKPFLDINKHLEHHPVKDTPRDALEERLAVATRAGDVDSAERLSDQLSAKQTGERICAAYEAQRYLVEQQQKKTAESLKKRKKLAWRFGAKERWESKGNM